MPTTIPFPATHPGVAPDPIDRPLPDLRRIEVQQVLGIESAKFYELVNGGQLEAYRLGGPKGAIRVTRESLDQFRARNRVQPKGAR